MNPLIPSKVRTHPIFAGGRYGLMSGENPLFPSAIQGGPSHEKLTQALKGMGLKFDETTGQYGNPERSVIIYNPHPEQMKILGKLFGQESVVFGQGGKHELIHTNGPHEGKAQKVDHGVEPLTFSYTKPENYFTSLPGQGFFSINFNTDKAPEPREG